MNSEMEEENAFVIVGFGLPTRSCLVCFHMMTFSWQKGVGKNTSRWSYVTKSVTPKLVKKSLLEGSIQFLITNYKELYGAHRDTYSASPVSSHDFHPLTSPKSESYWLMHAWCWIWAPFQTAVGRSLIGQPTCYKCRQRTLPLSLTVLVFWEMGRRCLFMSCTGLCLGTGSTSASFHKGGRTSRSINFWRYQ